MPPPPTEPTVDFLALKHSDTDASVTVTTNQVDVPVNSARDQYVMNIDTSDLSTVYEIELTTEGTRGTGYENNIWLLDTESMFIRQPTVEIPDYWQISYARFKITHPDYELKSFVDSADGYTKWLNITNRHGTPVTIKKIRIQAVEGESLACLDLWDRDVRLYHVYDEDNGPISSGAANFVSLSKIFC